MSSRKIPELNLHLGVKGIVGKAGVHDVPPSRTERDPSVLIINLFDVSVVQSATPPVDRLLLGCEFDTSMFVEVASEVIIKSTDR